MKSKKILSLFNKKKGQIAVLIDPDKYKLNQLKEFVSKCLFANIDYFFVGGSTGSRSDFEKCVTELKKITTKPIILFPGSSHHISKDADAILFLNLISGRNPDFLIGHHVQAAKELKESTLEIISTSYLLIDGGNESSVAYVSQTRPIPRNQLNLIEQTALAGELIGHQVLFLDAGSGAKQNVSAEIISKLRKQTNRPVIIGGGISSEKELVNLANAGANILVIGNKLEEDIDFLLSVQNFKQNFYR